MSIRDLTLTQTRTHARASDDADVVMQMDEDAFRGFYDRTARVLLAYLRRLTRDPHAADDLLQETYYRFLRADVRLTDEQHRRQYLFRIATNLTHDRFRQTRARPVHVAHDEAVAADMPRRGDEPLDRRLDVSTAFDQLGRRERALLWLAYAQGASHEEIASVVGVRRGSVKVLLFRARRRLAALLRPLREGR